MPTCCVPGCGISTGNNKFKRMSKSGVKITLHRLPKDTTFLKEFVNRIKQETGRYFQVSKTTSICSIHFKKEDFEELKKGVRGLKRNTLPTVFHCGSAMKASTEEEMIVQAELPEFDSSQKSVLEASCTDPNNEAMVQENSHGSSEEQRCTLETEPLSDVESVYCALDENDAMRLSFEEELAKEKGKYRRYGAGIERLSQHLQNALTDLQLTKEKLSIYEGELAKVKTKVHEQQSQPAAIE